MKKNVSRTSVLFGLILIVTSFQNCSGYSANNPNLNSDLNANFSSSSEAAAASGNGAGGYDGRLVFAHRLPNVECNLPKSKAPAMLSIIEEKPGIQKKEYVLTRIDCEDQDPAIELSENDIEFVGPDAKEIVYRKRRFTRLPVYRTPEGEYRVVPTTSDDADMSSDDYTDPDQILSYSSDYKNIVKTISVGGSVIPVKSLDQSSKSPTYVKTPAVTKDPIKAKTPVEPLSKDPVDSKVPTDTKSPTETKTPINTKTPVNTKTPTETKTPPMAKAPPVDEAPLEVKTPVQPVTKTPPPKELAKEPPAKEPPPKTPAPVAKTPTK